MSNTEAIGPLELRAKVEQWPLTRSFRISGYTFEKIDVLFVELEKSGCVGRGEAAGVYYKGDSPVRMLEEVKRCASILEGGFTDETLRGMLCSDGARNAVDCALWDLRAKLTGRPVWELAGLDAPRPLLTTFGCGAESPEEMTKVARSYQGARAIKLKLTGEDVDADRVRAVREGCPDVWLAVDANQGFTRPFLEKLMPVLTDARVSLIEQPFSVGQEDLLDGFHSPIPIAADESVQHPSDIQALATRFNVINIKLDKSGGLTDALAMARMARDLGLETMVGNMIGTSLAMAPAILVGQLCSVVDLDGPLFLKNDRAETVQYCEGMVRFPEGSWGDPKGSAARG
jgi:L-alanine-DL-glutamate epimerase-like enolase superfamily enzyme